MKINITKKQYAFFIEMCLLGAYIVEEAKIIDNKEYNEVLKYILSFGQEFGYNIDQQGLETIDEIAATVIDRFEIGEEVLTNYNEKIFWKELAVRMASRDALEIFGGNITSANYQQYVDLKKNLERKYFSRFEISKYSNNELPY